MEARLTGVRLMRNPMQCFASLPVSRKRTTQPAIATRLRRVSLTSAAALTLAALLTTQSADARVTRFVVEQRRSFAGGTIFGNVGPYERLDGTVYMEVSPLDPLNAIIINIDKASRNVEEWWSSARRSSSSS